MSQVKKKIALGFTLIEILVSMGIGLVVLAAVARSFTTQGYLYNVQDQVNAMQQNVRGALDIMSREIKMAGYKPNGGTVNGITTANSTQLRIQADLDGSTTITASSDEDIQYSFDGANLRITRNGVTLANSIENLSFEFFDANGAATATIANMRQIKINITTRTRNADPKYAANGGYRTYPVSALITPANLAF